MCAGLWTGSPESWSPESWEYLSPDGATESEAYCVYDGQQGGWVNLGGGRHAGLWTGSAESWIDLNPADASQSSVLGMHDGQLVGNAYVGGVQHASLWTGSGDLWVDLNLNPAGAGQSIAWSVYDGQQAGHAYVDDVWHAGVWTGSAESWVDLHEFLPSEFTWSAARGIWNDGVSTYVAGLGYNATAGREEALMWVIPEPATRPTLDGLIELINQLDDDVLSDELKTSLIAKVGAARRQSTKENIRAGVNILEAFQAQVEAQRGKKIADETAALLIEYAENLITQLLAELPEGEICLSWP